MFLKKMNLFLVIIVILELNSIVNGDDFQNEEMYNLNIIVFFVHLISD